MRRPEARFQHDAGALIPGLRHRMLALRDGELHCVEAGRGDPLLLIHGGHGSWTHWSANIEALARAHRVVALDLPGFGASYRPQSDYDLDQYAHVVIEALDALRIPQAAVAGFSFGGVVAAAAARRTTRLTRLVLVNAPGIGPVSPEAAALMRSLSALSLRAGLRAGALESLKRIQLCDHALIDGALVNRMLANLRLTRFVSRDLSNAARSDEFLAAFDRPALILIGREDVHRRFGLAAGLQWLGRHAPHAQVWLVERAAHWLQYDRAALFNACVADFLR